MNKPKISVIIVTRNRKDDVKVSIEAYFKQTYDNYEIIVIDNESDDGTREMMANDYPEIKYLWLPDNFDIRSINLGVEMSSGEIIWRTDSDSHPEADDTFQKIVDIFEKHNDIDIIASEDIEVRRNYEVWEWYPLKVDKENVPEKGYPANLFPGTGAAIRRKVFDKIGGFWEFGFEEIDFCTRAIVAGFNVRYFPQIRTLHYASPSDRFPANRWIQTSKQLIRYTWRYFPFFTAWWRSSQIFILQILFGIISRIPPMALLEGILTMQAVTFSTIRNERNVVPKDKMKDITLGVSITRNQYRFFIQKFKNFFKKWRKK